jgi:hypothetical protein
MRSIRRVIAAGAVVAATLVFTAAAASAAPFSINVNYGFASIGCTDGCTLTDESILDPTSVPAGVTLTDADGLTGNSFSFPPGQLIQKTFTVTIPGDPPADVDVTLTLNAIDPITGTYDSATGQILANAPHVAGRAQADLDGTAIDCTIDPVSFALTTDANSYHAGVRWNHGAPPAGPGALAASWTDLPSPVPSGTILDPWYAASAVICPSFDSYVDGPGGVWLSHDLSTIGNPPSPTGLATNPGSPNESNTPLVHGTGAAEPGGVFVWTNGTCTGDSAASGSSATFNGAGIPVTVPEDSTTQISVQVVDAAFRVSPCSAISYTDPTAPPPGTGGDGGGTVTPPPAVKKCKKTQKLKKGKCVKKKKKKKK